MVRFKKEDGMIPLYNFTPTEGWSSFNITCQTYKDVYLNAYKQIGQQLGFYLLLLAIVAVLSAIVFRLWDKGKISEKRFKWSMTIIIGLELFWIFNLVGMFLLMV